ncbi:DUF4365 domain-containing protein [Rheinheimera texasensis]|uniref:DUF4365 domain-containing protein n=1 Tax=Rheinheimera texasensis TaxID=306205 RepID=UPI0032B1D11F
MNQLPTESSSQEIGRLAERSLLSQIPVSWIHTPASGDTDFGIDYLMQIKNTNDEVSFNFYLQLKGTMNPVYSADKKFITVDIKLSTIMYYRATEPAVILAMVDLKDHGGAWYKCPIYYLILEDAFFLELAGKEGQNTVSVKIPTNNLVTSTLDLFGYFQNRFTEQLAVSGLKKQLSDINMPLTPAIDMITRGLEQKPIYLDSMANPIDAPWVHSPEGSNAAALENSWNLLSSNKIVLADHALSLISQQLSGLTSNECAEYHFQMARLLSYQGNQDGAKTHYLHAHQACERQRYKLAYLESLFDNEEELPPEILQYIIDASDTQSYQSCFLKAKCMALLGQVDDALTLMETQYSERIAGRLVILCVGERFLDADALLAKADQLSFHNIHDEYIFHVVAARRLYFVHFAEDTSEMLLVPVHGLATYNASKMNRAMTHISRAWALSLELPHLPNIDQLITVSLPVCGYFDRLSELAQHIEPFYRERSKDQALTRNYSRVLWHLNRFADVINVIQRLIAPDGFDLYLLIISTYMMGRKKDALKLLMSSEDKLFDLSNPSALSAVAMGVQWASELLEHKVARRYSALLESSEEGRTCLAILECEKLCKDNPAQRKEHLLHLHNVYCSTGKPLPIAQCLLENLDAQDEESANIIISLSDFILLHKELSPEHYLTRAHSFLTTKDWESAEGIATKKVGTGDNGITWSLILAASLKAQGRLGESLSVLKKDLELVQLSSEALQFYIEISMSLGLLEDVIGEIKTLYAKATTRQLRVEVLSRLLMVYVQSKAYREDLKFALAEYGRLVDQNSMREEGSFLMLSLTVSSCHLDTAETKAEFQARLRTYTEQFPDSPILWKKMLHVDVTPEELLRQLQQISGTTDDQIRQSEINTQAIRDGSLLAPFVVRTRLMLGIKDIFALWHKAQTTPAENLEFKIKHAPQLTWVSFEQQTRVGLHLLFDETSLLILYEIGALDAALIATDRCYILQSTFNAIRDAHNIWEGSWSTIEAEDILKSLHAILPKITIIEPTTGLSNALAFDLYADAVKQTGAMFICDDQNLVWAVSHLHGSVPSGNSVNVIEYLYRKGQIDGVVQAQLIGMYSQLPAIIGINIRIDYAATILEHCLPQRVYVDFTGTPFGHLFNKIILGNGSDNEIVIIVLKILQAAQLIRPIDPIVVLDILEATQQYYQKLTVPEIVGRWFLYQCINTPASSSVLYIRDDNKRAIWLAYSQMMNKYTNSIVSDIDLLIPILQSLRNFAPDVRNNTYSALESCIAFDGTLLQTMRFILDQLEVDRRLLQSK